MKEILFGILAGIVTSLGMGGGVILILLLSLFSNLNQHMMQGVNLLFFIPTSVVANFMNVKNKNIDYKICKTVATTGIIGAAIGSNLSFKISNENLKKYFGIFLCFIAIFEIYSFFKKYILPRKRK